LIWGLGVVLTLALVLLIMLTAGLPADLRSAVLTRMVGMANRLYSSQQRFGA
jgi:hypothetical protein